MGRSTIIWLKVWAKVEILELIIADIVFSWISGIIENWLRLIYVSAIPIFVHYPLSHFIDSPILFAIILTGFDQIPISIKSNLFVNATGIVNNLKNQIDIIVINWIGIDQTGNNNLWTIVIWSGIDNELNHIHHLRGAGGDVHAKLRRKMKRYRWVNIVSSQAIRVNNYVFQ